MGANAHADKVFFGFKDSISQPRFAEIRDDPDTEKANEPIDPLGTALLGYQTRLERLRFRVPEPDSAWVQWELQRLPHPRAGRRGVRRISHQGGERSSKTIPTSTCCWRQAARRRSARVWTVWGLCARSSQLRCADAGGTAFPMAPRPTCNGPSAADFRDQFRLRPQPRDVPPARTCGASIRAAGRSCSGSPTTPGALIRRGMPYGPDYNPDHPDDQERGLLGNFIGASLGAQFEAIMCDWLNLGLQDPDITGSNDPLIGANYAGDELVRSVAQERRQHPPSRIPALRDHPRRGLHFPAKPAGDRVLVEANHLSGRVRSESGTTARLIPEGRSAPPAPPRSAPAWETDRTR